MGFLGKFIDLLIKLLDFRILTQNPNYFLGLRQNRMKLGSDIIVIDGKSIFPDY